MRYLFTIQGEGRGHLTQSIALSSYLRSEGHEVVAAIVGSSGERKLPKFFYDKIGTPVTEIFSPNFVFDKKHKGVLLWTSIAKNLLAWRKTTSSLKSLKMAVERHQPDAVISFFEPLTGLLYGLHQPKPPLFCIGHQYLSLRADFPFPKHSEGQQRLMHFFTRLTSWNAHKRLALSFDKLPDQPEDKLFVVPPLLRQEIFSKTPEKSGGFLIYILNHGYSEEIIAWKKNNANIDLDVFWDNFDKPDGYSPTPGLIFYHINDELFLEKLRCCTAYASTAGFESICEAAYFDKPIMLVPSHNHFEQRGNALDAERCGLGIGRQKFMLDDLLHLTKTRPNGNRVFKAWVDSSKELFLSHLK